MRLSTFASILVVASGCSGGSKKKSDNTTPSGNGQDMMGDTSTTGGTKSEPPPPPDTGGYKLIAPSAVTYSPLDPTAKTPGPEVAVLHGDPKSGGVFLLKVAPGGKSGLHTHTSDYHAIVVSGAPKHYLPGGEKKAKPLEIGSYWFQPGNQPHGDECTGTEPCVRYLIFPGAFDFTATPKAKKVAAGKYKLVARKSAKFAPIDPSKPDGMKAAFVHGDPKTGPVGFLLEVPAGATSGLHSHTSDYHAIVLEGAPAHWLPHEKGVGDPVSPGTYWFQPGGYDHHDRCASTTPCLAFVFMDKALDFKPAASGK